MSRGEPATRVYEAVLRELVQLLQRSPATARQIAEAFDCSRGTAHKRLSELHRRGIVQVRRIREGMCGPQSALYVLKNEERRA